MFLYKKAILTPYYTGKNEKNSYPHPRIKYGQNLSGTTRESAAQNGK